MSEVKIEVAQASASGPSSADATPAYVSHRAEELFTERCMANYVRTDRMFAVLLVLEWIAGVVVSLIISPRTWSGANSDVNIHVLMAAGLGAAIIAVPLIFIFAKPGAAITRHAVAVGQLLYSSLLIHLTGGRIETHFHIFGSLAFLSFYRDWRVLITASIVVLIDHCVGGYYFPVSVYGIAEIQPLRWLEHAWWVVFEDVFLILANVSQVQEMKSHARNQAAVEATQGHISKLEELRQREHDQYRSDFQSQQLTSQHLATVVKLSEKAIIGQSKDGTITHWNNGAQKIFGYTEQEVIGRHIKLLVPIKKSDEINQLIADAKAGKTNDNIETVRLHKDSKYVKVLLTRIPLFDTQNTLLGVSEIMEEISVPSVEEALSPASLGVALEPPYS